MTEYAVEIDGLVKTFGDNRAVDGVTLRVPKGTIYGILGPNGAGKTTTINILATLMKSDGGSAKVFGHDVLKEAHIVRKMIGVTGQYASVDESLSATENLVIFGMLRGLKRKQAAERAAELLEEFGLTEAANRPLHKFSGGMRRRLDIAAGLIVIPDLMFLDEPTTGLDPRTRAQMWNTIRALAAKGTTVMLTTQYLDEADNLASRIAVIDHGRVIAEGTPDELKSSVGSSTLVLDMGSSDQSAMAQEIIFDVLGVRSKITDAGRIVTPIAKMDAVADLLIGFREAGLEVQAISIQKPTLDEVFLTITGKTAEDEAGVEA
ncbi:MAG: ATP-binding cassette domain-containing protein [Candidatus Methanoplasma sp.]|jgi:ABC-2 type transport system ATP-binding protein|nr:ATP-binding cassette domain-containing protein [Candidatus Methanoplasma sp.]